MTSSEYKNEGYEGGFGGDDVVNIHNDEGDSSEIYEMIDDVNHRGDVLASPTNEKLIKGEPTVQIRIQKWYSYICGSVV